MPESESSPATSKVRPPWWFRLIRALLNLALVGLLCLQSFALIILWTDNHLGLPGFVRHALEDRMQGQGLSVRFRSLEVSLSGRLFLREPQVYLAGAREPVAEADYLEIDPDWLALWWDGQFAFSELRLYNATVYSSPEFSPTGLREAIIQRLDIGLASQGHRWWLLDHLRGQFLNADIQAHGTFLWPSSKAGSLSPAAPIVTQPASSSSLTLATRFRQWTRAAVNLQPQVNRVVSPVLQIDLAGEESGETRINATFLARGAKLPDNGLVLGELQGRGSFIWDGDAVHVPAPIFAGTDSVHLDKLAEASFASGQTWLKIEPASGANDFWNRRPKRIQFCAADAAWGSFALDSVTSDLDLQKWPQLSLSALVTQGLDSLKMAGQVKVDMSGSSPDLGDGQIDFRVQAPAATLLAAGHWTLPPELGSLKFDDVLRADGRVELAAGHRLDSLEWTVHAGGTHFQNIDLEQAMARGSIERDATGNYLIDLTQISLINKTWRVDGSYFENLQTHEFRVLARGSLDPAVLNSYLGEWWQPLWQFIAPQGHWPEADVEYSGNWDSPWWAKELFVYAQVKNARVQGVPMDSIRIRAVQRPEYIAVYDIAAHATGGGDLSGAMIWAIKPAISHIVEQRYFFDSTLPLAAVAATTGPQIADLVNPLDCPVPPTIHVDQRTGTAFNAQPEAVLTKVHAELSTPFRIFNVPLDRASLDATDDGGVTDISHLNFGIAGGSARAEASVTHTSGTPQLKFSLLVQNAGQADFLNALGQLSAVDNPSQQASNPKPAVPAAAANKSSVLGGLEHPGLLDLALGGQFDFGKPDSLLSSGEVRIHDAQLGQLQLFGRLSKLLADTKVPLGDFDLHSAEGEIQIANDYVRLPNLVITGPTARIQAAGTYHFADGALNFNTLIFPIGQSEEFLLKQMATISNPFVNTVTLKLQGTFEKPAWEISMNPLRLFKDRTVEGPPIPGIRATADGAPELPVLPVAPPLPDLPVEKR